jgi:mono/diheme cytochrome c family protein
MALLIGVLGSTGRAAEGAEAGATRPWSEERAERQAAHERYLASQPVAYDWFLNSPLGFNGQPVVLLRAISEALPEIWRGEGSFANLGFGPRPEDYDGNGRLRPAIDRAPLPFGFAVVADPNMPAEARLDRVFFSCAACHAGRVVVDGKVRRLMGAPNTEVETQAYSGLWIKTADALIAEDSPDPAQIKLRPEVVAKIASVLQTQPPEWFYGGATPKERGANALRAAEQVKILLANLDAPLRRLAVGMKGTRLVLRLGSQYFVERDGRRAPALLDGRPGRMDAFGLVTGLVAVHALRPDNSFFKRLPDDHFFFRGLPADLGRDERNKLAAQRLFATAPEWIPREPAPSDISSLWFSRDRALANWDGNQGIASRVLSSGVAAVGDPSLVNVRVHEPMNAFIEDMPPPPYPFDVDTALAARGRELFDRDCRSCHRARNADVYDVGTDMARARQVSMTARVGLLELTRETCEISIARGGSDWCLPKRGSREADDEELFRTPRGAKSGYKADVLHGIWAQAPYLHNGSVPTLWHLLRPASRPARFIRGNINYDTRLVGFVWDKAPAIGAYGEGDAVHWAEQDVAVRGNDNAGHEYGRDWTDEQAWAVIEYMKTF